MPDNVEQIAAGLSDASRLALVNCRESDSGAYWLTAHATILRLLWKRDLATFRARPSRLTPLGQQVRAHILGEKP